MVWLTVMLCASRVVITEVMANPKGSTGAHGPEDRNEFVELYNPTGRSVDLYDWTLDDGDSKDRIIAWRDSSIRAHDTTLLVGTTWLPPNSYAVVLDSEYADPETVGGRGQPYRFGPGTLMLTTANTTLGNGLAGTDPILICSPYGDTSTFGTPFDTTDELPRDAGDGFSWERIDVTGPDVVGNWAVCPDSAGCTPGRANRISSWFDLAVTSLAPADTASPQPTEPVSILVRVVNQGHIPSAPWHLSAWLDINSNQRRDPTETVVEQAGDPLWPGQDTVVAAAVGCPESPADLWVELSCPGDGNSLNNASRIAVKPGGMSRFLSLLVSDFSPDGDGFEDSLPIVLRLPGPRGRLRVEVFDLGGRRVRTLAGGGLRPATDAVCLYWDGRRHDGERLPRGIYAVWAEYAHEGRVISEKLPVVLVR